MCPAQGHNAVMPMRLKPANTLSRVKHLTTEQLQSIYCKNLKMITKSLLLNILKTKETFQCLYIQLFWVLVIDICASASEILSWVCANNKSADKPEHPRRLTSAFVIGFLMLSIIF